MSIEAGFDSVTESCDTISTEIEFPPVLNAEITNDDVLLPEETSQLQAMQNRIVLRAFLRAWLQNHRQRMASHQ